MLTLLCFHLPQESADSMLSVVKQRTGSFGDRPAKPTLLEQVLNQKRLVSICEAVTDLLAAALCHKWNVSEFQCYKTKLVPGVEVVPPLCTLVPPSPPGAAQAVSSIPSLTNA